MNAELVARIKLVCEASHIKNAYVIYEVWSSGQNSGFCVRDKKFQCSCRSSVKFRFHAP